MVISGCIRRRRKRTSLAACASCRSAGVTMTIRGRPRVSRRIRSARWSRIWPVIPAAAQRAMNPQTVRQGGKSRG